MRCERTRCSQRGEIRSLENQLAIASNQLTLTQQQNTSLAQTDAQRSAQLSSANMALESKERRISAAEAAVGEARAESTARQEELVRLGEKLGAAHEERDLLTQQLMAAKVRRPAHTACRWWRLQDEDGAQHELLC
jgi:chromosome segregation ATPase